MSPLVNTVPTQTLRGELNARFSRPLMSFFLRRVRDRALAEDLTQEVLLRVVRACECGPIEQAEHYVFKVAANLLKDRRRSALRAGPAVFVSIDDVIEQETESSLVEPFSPERVLLSEESLAGVMRALHELGDQTRSIFILFRLENMKQKDIAALFGISQSTVEKHVMKAMLHLASRFGDRR